MSEFSHKYKEQIKKADDGNRTRVKAPYKYCKINVLFNFGDVFGDVLRD